MTRELHFPVRVVPERGGAPRLRVSIAPDYSAADMAGSAIPANTILPALQVFAAIAGDTGGRAAPAVSGREIVFALPASVAADAWKVAVLVNLVDFATAADGDMDERISDGVTVEATALAGLDLPALHAALEARKEAARAEMTVLLPPDFEVHPDIGREWPVDAVEFLIKVEMGLARPLAAAEANSARLFLETLDSLVAWTGFETERNPETWLENGWVPYPVEITVEDDQAVYDAEMPPSDVSLVFVLFGAGLQRSLGIAIDAWDFEFREGF